MKTQEELKKLKEEYETLNNKLKELSEDELKEVTGGGIKDWFDKIGDMTKKVVPVESDPFLGETQTGGEDWMGGRQFWDK